jgi:hypothetical protein
MDEAVRSGVPDGNNLPFLSSDEPLKFFDLFFETQRGFRRLKQAFQNW